MGDIGIFRALYKLECLTAESEETKDLLIFIQRLKFYYLMPLPRFYYCVYVCVL